MNYNIIHIFGASGSGVSTLGKKLYEKFGYQQLDVDDYFWLPTNPPYIEKRDKDKRIELLKNDIDKYGKVVITGSLCNWGDSLVHLFDLAIRTNINHDLRMKRLIEREINRYGDEIKLNGNMYKSHLEFIGWASKYDTADNSIRSNALHNEWQKKLKCPLLIVNTTDTTEAIEMIANFIGI